MSSYIPDRKFVVHKNVSFLFEEFDNEVASDMLGLPEGIYAKGCIPWYIQMTETVLSIMSEAAIEGDIPKIGASIKNLMRLRDMYDQIARQISPMFDEKTWTEADDQIMEALVAEMAQRGWEPEWTEIDKH